MDKRTRNVDSKGFVEFQRRTLQKRMIPFSVHNLYSLDKEVYLKLTGQQKTIMKIVQP